LLHPIAAICEKSGSIVPVLRYAMQVGARWTIYRNARARPSRSRLRRFLIDWIRLLS
jgi:hypothetical protein